MSASTEQLVEEIKLVEAALFTAEANGDVETTINLKRDLRYLQRKLTVCNEALTEGAQRLLKG